jgi:hypothetical protein
MDFEAWTLTPKQVDVEDLRLIMTLFIESCRHSRPGTVSRSPVLLLRLIPFATDAGSQDILPDVLKCDIMHAWAALLYLEKDTQKAPLLLSAFVFKYRK